MEFYVFIEDYPSLINAPLSRFGDTAMNTLVNTALENSKYSVAEKTFFGSCGAGLWRICIMPQTHLKVVYK